MQKNTSARSEFSSAVNQIAHERNLDPNVVIDAIKQSIIAAFKKDHLDSYKEDHVYDVDMDSGSGEAKVYEIAGEAYEEDGVTLYKPKKGAKRVEVTPPGFGRIAAQTAKQVILQKIREAEKSSIVAEYEKRIGTLVNGLVIRVMGNEVVVDVGKTEAILPREEQIHSEAYHPNLRLTFYIHSIRDGLRGREVIISRSDVGLVKELFRREVPEIASGSVEIKAITRDPGSRSKIAVYSHQSGVDPVGSCVGQKGVRVQAVIGELGGEKIDIVQFNEDPQKFVAAALSPASELVVEIDEKKKIATVTAPADQLSLAIGREGQNAKLAGKLTGYHVDIKGSDKPSEAGTHELKEDVPTATQDETSSS